MRLLPQINASGLFLGYKEIYDPNFDPSSAHILGFPKPDVHNYAARVAAMASQYSSGGIPTDCIDLAMPDFSPDDEVYYIDGSWVVHVNAKQIKANAAHKATVFTQYNNMRALALNALTGISGRAARQGDVVLAQQSDALAQFLLDLKMQSSVIAADTGLGVQQAMAGLIDAYLAEMPKTLVSAIRDAGFLTFTDLPTV